MTPLFEALNEQNQILVMRKVADIAKISFFKNGIILDDTERNRLHEYWSTPEHIQKLRDEWQERIKNPPEPPFGRSRFGLG